MPKEKQFNFPKWKILPKTKHRIFDNLCAKKAFKAFRQSSSAFIKNPVVRISILNKSNYQCVYCSSLEKLEVDHILSVHYCFKHGFIYECNTYDNLQILCKSCNCSKLP